jgi:hypothetical protein
MALSLCYVSVSVLVCVCLLLQQQDAINEDIVEIDEKMDTLKTILKSKFGSQVSVKRDLLQFQKRPSTVSKETQTLNLNLNP